MLVRVIFEAQLDLAVNELDEDVLAEDVGHAAGGVHSVEEVVVGGVVVVDRLLVAVDFGVEATLSVELVQEVFEQLGVRVGGGGVAGGGQLVKG